MIERVWSDMGRTEGRRGSMQGEGGHGERGENGENRTEERENGGGRKQDRENASHAVLWVLIDTRRLTGT